MKMTEYEERGIPSPEEYERKVNLAYLTFNEASFTGRIDVY